MNTKRYTFSLVVVEEEQESVVCFCASFCVEEETKKERFFEAYEKGVRSTKDALHEYERSTHRANV